MMATIDIPNEKEGVEVTTPFWMSAMEVLKNDAKCMQWLQMPKVKLFVDEQTS